MNKLINITDLIINLINDHYYDLQMFSNYVISVDSDPRELSTDHNISIRLAQITNAHSTDRLLFSIPNMNSIKEYVNIINEQTNLLQFNSRYIDFNFFNCGSTSTSILFKKDNTIIKIFPCQLIHHYHFFSKKINKEIIYRDYESPFFALFYKEAWMYSFCKNIMSQYTSAFDCIINCGTINEFPIKTTKKIISDYKDFVRLKKNGKKWFDDLIQNKKKIINKATFAVFEMKEIEGTMTDIIKLVKHILCQLKNMDNISDNPKISDELYQKLSSKKLKNQSTVGLKIINSVINKYELMNQKKILQKELAMYQIDLSYFFEYMYAKMIIAYIGKIIFTDDHFDNIAYITVEYWRSYKIKCNGCDYYFYMPPGKMVQFIDYERYIFNYSHYDIYTNAALKQIPKEDFLYASDHLKEVNNQYITNEYIYDKGINAFIDPRELDPKVFVSKEEYDIMVDILMDNFVYDIRTFCQVMSQHLPKKYQTEPDIAYVKEFYIDLDDDNARAIDNEIMENITR